MSSQEKATLEKLDKISDLIATYIDEDYDLNKLEQAFDLVEELKEPYLPGKC